MPRVASNLAFLCHAWLPCLVSHAWHEEIKFDATRGTQKVSMPRVASNLTFLCHAWPPCLVLLPDVAQRRPLCPPPGLCATCGMHAARSAPRPAHVPRVDPLRTRRPLAVHVPHVA